MRRMNVAGAAAVALIAMGCGSNPECIGFEKRCLNNQPQTCLNNQGADQGPACTGTEPLCVHCPTNLMRAEFAACLSYSGCTPGS